MIVKCGEVSKKRGEMVKSRRKRDGIRHFTICYRRERTRRAPFLPTGGPLACADAQFLNAIIASNS